MQRRSCRAFSGESIPLKNVEEILKFSGREPFRSPSLLSDDFLESYLISNSIEGLNPGIYKLENNNGTLSELIPGNFNTEILQMSLGQELSATSSFVIVHAVSLSDLVLKFGDRGYRYICMDAGIIGQRINLICESKGLGASGIGGYFDDMVNKTLLLTLDKANIYMTVVGVPTQF